MMASLLGRLIDPSSRVHSENHAPMFIDRVCGGIYGALLGDALGVPVEFRPRHERDRRPICGMTGFGTHDQPPGTWSDDGALLLCQADSFLDGPSPAEFGQHALNWFRRGAATARGFRFDCGSTTLTALSRLTEGSAVESAGPDDELSNGNGSLMRILPVGIYFWNASDDVICGWASRFSAVTHGHIRARTACGFYCMVAARLVRGMLPRHAYLDACRAAGKVFAALPIEESIAFARVFTGQLTYLRRDQIASDGYVVHTLEAALWCLVHGSDFEEVVLTAVNLGEDTDTTAAVAGGLSGIARGFAQLPRDWVGELPRQGLIDGYCQRFVDSIPAGTSADAAA